MNYLRHKVLLLAITIGLFSLCFMAGCEQEDNRFKLNSGMQFKEVEEREQQVTGSGDDQQDGQNENPNKEGTKKKKSDEEDVSSKTDEEMEEDTVKQVIFRWAGTS